MSRTDKPISGNPGKFPRLTPKAVRGFCQSHVINGRYRCDGEPRVRTPPDRAAPRRRAAGGGRAVCAWRLLLECNESVGGRWSPSTGFAGLGPRRVVWPVRAAAMQRRRRRQTRGVSASPLAACTWPDLAPWQRRPAPRAPRPSPRTRRATLYSPRAVCLPQSRCSLASRRFPPIVSRAAGRSIFASDTSKLATLGSTKQDWEVYQ